MKIVILGIVISLGIILMFIYITYLVFKVYEYATPFQRKRALIIILGTLVPVLLMFIVQYFAP